MTLHWGKVAVIILVGLLVLAGVTLPRHAVAQAPGVDIAFSTRPANTVAGDYYDAILRGPVDGEPRRLENFTVRLEPRALRLLIPSDCRLLSSPSRPQGDV